MALWARQGPIELTEKSDGVYAIELTSHGFGELSTSAKQLCPWGFKQSEFRAFDTQHIRYPLIKFLACDERPERLVTIDGKGGPPCSSRLPLWRCSIAADSKIPNQSVSLWMSGEKELGVVDPRRETVNRPVFRAISKSARSPRDPCIDKGRCPQL